MSERIIERFYPYIITSIILIIYYLYFPNDATDVFVKKPFNLITLLMTLSSVSLGFVCAMIGVLISLKDSSIMKLLKSKNALKDLFRYVQESCIFDFISLAFSMYFFITLKENSTLLQIHAYLLLSFMLIIILSSYRMIRILFSLTKSSIITKSSKELEETRIFKPDPNKLKAPRAQLRKKHE